MKARFGTRIPGILPAATKIAADHRPEQQRRRQMELLQRRDDVTAPWCSRAPEPLNHGRGQVPPRATAAGEFGLDSALFHFHTRQPSIYEGKL